MNKNLTKIVGLTLGLSMAVGVGVGISATNGKQANPVYADTTGSLEITISNFTEITNSYTTEYTHNYTVESSTVSVEAYGVFKNANGIQMNSGKGTYIKNTTALPGYITSIVCTWTATGKNSPTLYVNSGSVASKSSTSLGKGSNAQTTQTYTVSNAATSNMRYFYFDGTTVTGACYMSNFVINYTVPSGGGSSSSNPSSSSEPEPVTYHVTYATGGAQSGDVPTDDTAYTENATVTVLGNTGSLVKNGYTFSGWNDGTADRAVGSTFQITSDVTLTAVWTEEVDAEAVTYNLNQMAGFSSWGASYSDHSHTYNVSANETALVTIKDSCKQTTTITDVPVSKGGDVTFVLSSETRYIKNITFHARQWTTKAQTMTLYSSTNSGSTYVSTEISTNYFLIRGKNFSSGTNAVKITFNSSSNQVGYVDFAVTYANLPDVEATAMNIAPASLSLFGEETGNFTPTLSGGTGNYEKTIGWTSSHPSIIAAPEDSEAGEEISVTPERVAANTNVTLTGTVKVAGGASASIVITVKLIKEISVDSVAVSGITNNSILNGLNDNSIAVNKTFQLSATVNYNQGDAFMDGDGSVTWLSNAPSVATVSSTGLVTLCSNGTVTITATSVENTNKFASLTFTVSNINEVLGSQDNPFTVTQAKAALQAANDDIENIYISGKISQVDEVSLSYKNATYWISDDGTTTNQFKIYHGKFVDNADFTSEDQIGVGDTITVYGTISHQYSNLNAGNYIVSLVSAPKVNSISLTPSSINVEPGETGNIVDLFTNIVINQNDSSHKTVEDIEWSSDDDNVLCVLGDQYIAGDNHRTSTTLRASINGVEYGTAAISVVDSGIYSIDYVAPYQWELVDDPSTLIPGDKVILTGIKDEVVYAAGTYSSGNNVPSDSHTLTVSGNKVTGVVNEMIYSLEEGSEDGSVAFKDSANKYLYAAGGTGNNYLKTQATIDGNASFILNADGTVVAQGASTRNYMRYNNTGSNNLFNCYGSTGTTGDLVTFYKRIGGPSVLDLPSASSVATLQARETIDGGNLVVDQVSIRFGATISVSDWDALDSAVGIEDYGVMLFRTTEANLPSVLSVEEYYNLNPSNVSIVRKNSDEAPTPIAGVYDFSVQVNVSSTSKFNRYYVAAPFILAGGQYYFLPELQYSVNSLAEELYINGGSALSDDALEYLATTH